MAERSHRGRKRRCAREGCQRVAARGHFHCTQVCRLIALEAGATAPAPPPKTVTGRLPESDNAMRLRPYQTNRPEGSSFRLDLPLSAHRQRGTPQICLLLHSRRTKDRNTYCSTATHLAQQLLPS